MSNKLNFEELKKIIVSISEIDEATITRESHFIKDLGFHSLLTLELLVRLEEDYEIVVPQSEVHNLQTVGATLDFVSKMS